jgi:glycosyltransferase involved in cell wall biosynthesis
MDPKVTFIVPCYKLAHLLPDCINSILGQTFRDFEILIMDDASPDNTPEVAASFNDPRVIHVRNNPNLGHLRNYNKGIAMSRGNYVWLISADDYLRKPYVLERYVKLMDENPQTGFVFCPGVKVIGGKEIGTLDYSMHGDKDAVFEGRQFLAKLVKENTIVAASGMVRKTIYDTVSVFPLDMPWGGDWYLWCVFALHSDVGYLAEPMVCYREHELSMTNKLMDEDVAHCTWEDLMMPWTMKKKVEEAGYKHLVKSCLDSAAYDYARRLTAKRYKTASAAISFEEFEEFLCKSTPDEKERDYVRGQVYAAVADTYYWSGEQALASQFYSKALRKQPWMPKVWGKRLLLASGGLGSMLRKGRANVVRQ